MDAENNGWWLKNSEASAVQRVWARTGEARAMSEWPCGLLVRRARSIWRDASGSTAPMRQSGGWASPTSAENPGCSPRWVLQIHKTCVKKMVINEYMWGLCAGKAQERLLFKFIIKEYCTIKLPSIRNTRTAPSAVLYMYDWTLVHYSTRVKWYKSIYQTNKYS